MTLTTKQYQKIKLATVIILAMVFSQSIIYKNFFIPVALLVVGSLVLLYLRKQVKEVIVDERDKVSGGKAAMLAIQIYAWIAVVAMFLLYSLVDLNPYYNSIAMTLAFSTTILMLIYSVIFSYYNKMKFSDKKLVYTVVVLILFMFIAIFSLRVFSGEDNWVCDGGKWVEHGHPDFLAPTVECK